jgi:hypothetical protein
VRAHAGGRHDQPRHPADHHVDRPRTTASTRG